ncbi:hypothetical protein FQA39_LY15464 [Lamprigera yunnana]|nr:hypothetical protein FQA39_LY15464 [Lamprigera yunnana]
MTDMFKRCAFYWMQLPVVQSLQQLEGKCLQLEVKKFRVDNYQPLHLKKSSLVKPDLAYVHVLDELAAEGESLPMNAR